MKMAQGSILMSIVITGFPSIRSHVAGAARLIDRELDDTVDLLRHEVAQVRLHLLLVEVVVRDDELEAALRGDLLESLPDLHSERELFRDVREPDLEPLAGLALADLGKPAASLSRRPPRSSRGGAVWLAVTSGSAVVAACCPSSPPPHAATARTTTAAGRQGKLPRVECLSSSASLLLRVARHVSQTIPECPANDSGIVIGTVETCQTARAGTPGAG